MSGIKVDSMFFGVLGRFQGNRKKKEGGRE